jgi:hypothetical protein
LAVDSTLVSPAPPNCRRRCRSSAVDAGAHGAAEGRVVLLQEARQVLALGVVVLDEHGQVSTTSRSTDGRGRPRARVLEVLVEHEDARVVGDALPGLGRQQVGIGRRRDAEAVEEAGAEGVLRAAAVRERDDASARPGTRP